MSTVFVKALVDIDCEWEGYHPIYRIYLNDELFTERTWIWTDQYLTEIMQIQAQPGRYEFRLESVGPNLANFVVRNHRVEHGPAQWTKKGRILEIMDESARIPA